MELAALVVVLIIDSYPHIVYDILVLLATILMAAMAAVLSAAKALAVPVMVLAAMAVKAGPAAVGQNASDFWNFYTRDDGAGGWRTFGVVSNLKVADGTTTATGSPVTILRT